MKTLKIELGTRSYPIHIGKDLLNQSKLFAPHVRGHQLFVVSNEVVAPHYLQRLVDSLMPLGEVISFVLPDGEQTKSLSTVDQVFSKMLEVPCDRKTTVIALGGGVTGDLVGFSAACYLRGVDFVQVPTTLLSQVDSSVGGKTGVNHPLGKNMIGAFYQPKAVIIDINTLRTLDDRQFSAGLAEVIKYGLLGDIEFLDWVEANIESIMQRDHDALTYIIDRSCQAKANVVAADEREQGVRALLNLGHTFGHAIEHAKGYGEWLHGEAVGLGMLMAADLSRRLGSISVEDVIRVKEILSAAKLPVLGVDGVTSEQLHQLMAVDKKVERGRLNFVVFEELGKTKVTNEVGQDTLMQTLNAFVL